MNTSLKVQSYLKGLILFTVLLTNQAMGQSNVKKSFNEYMGTWSGFAKQSLEQMQKQKGIHLIWRVHKIDALKNEIEITQVGQRFDDGSEIQKPKKANIISSHSSDHKRSIGIPNDYSPTVSDQ